MEKEHLVFVYGTLRQGHSNHQLMGDAHCYGIGHTRDRFAMYVVSGYPYVTAAEERYPIVGELYAVDGEMLEKLDKMEGHPHFYVRREVAVDVGGEEYRAWMYVRDPPGTLLATGDYNDVVARIRPSREQTNNDA